MTKNLYDELKKQAAKTTLAEKQEKLMSDFLDSYFESNFKKEMHFSVQPLIHRTLLQMMAGQNADLEAQPDNLFGFMSEDELLKITAHLYMAIKANPILKEIEENSENADLDDEEYAATVNRLEAFKKLFNQGNPYVLRAHVFSLGNRLDKLLKLKGEGHEGYEDEVIIDPTEENIEDETLSRISRTLVSLVMAEKHIDEWVNTSPAYAYLMKGIIQYHLAKQTDEDKKKHHHQKAYEHLLKYEKNEHHSPKFDYLVTLGRGHQGQLPHEDYLTEIKNELEKSLTKEERAQIVQMLEARANNLRK